MTSAMLFLTLGLLTTSSSIQALGPLPVSRGLLPIGLGPLPVNLGTAANYAILGQTGVSTVPSSAIVGNVGLGPAAATFLTGFSPTLDPTGTFSTSVQVTGKLFAASYKSPTPSTLATAVLDSQAAYNDASTRPSPNFLNLDAGLIGGATLLPGLYRWTSGVSVGSDVTLVGTPLDTWILQITGTFSIATGKHVILVGGALASNIIWVVTGSTTIAAGAHLEGVLLEKTSATLQTGATVNGRILAQQMIALQQVTITAPL